VNVGVFDVVSIVGGFLLTCLVSLVAVIFNDLRRHVREQGRHIESVIAMQWAVTWRLNGVEDYLRSQHGYTPPRQMGIGEHFESGDE
jgi:hypothetical protein